MPQFPRMKPGRPAIVAIVATVAVETPTAEPNYRNYRNYRNFCGTGTPLWFDTAASVADYLLRWRLGVRGKVSSRTGPANET